MKHNCTDIVYIIDKSSYMSGREEAVIAAYNAELANIVASGAETYITTVIFDEHAKYLIRRVPAIAAKRLTKGNYSPAGESTLYDTIGVVFSIEGHDLSDLVEELRPDHVVVNIITAYKDTMSTVFGDDDIQAIIDEQKYKYSWDIRFPEWGR